MSEVLAQLNVGWDGTDPLSPAHKAILDFEGNWRQYDGRKFFLVGDRFDLMPHYYDQILRTICAWPEAQQYAPLVCRRVNAAPRGTQFAWEDR